MDDDILYEEMSIMYREPDRMTVLDSRTFLKPIRNLRVRKPLVVQRGRTVREALDLMQEKRASCLLITDGDRLAGILTERDIVRKGLAPGTSLTTLRVEEIMTPDPESFQPDDSVAFVVNAMHVGGYRHVPVVDEKHRPVATVSVRDLIGFIVEHFSEDILNLPPRPVRTARAQDGG